jgi:hypothetical protein
MRPIVIGLIAAVMAAVAPAAALAANAPAKPAPVVISPDAKAKGMKDGPGVISGAGLDCQLADARLIGTSADPKTKAQITYYELACKDSEGFIVGQQKAPGPYLIYTCLEVAAQPGAGVGCALPENANPKAGLAALIAKQKPVCQMADARAVGQAADHSVIEFEATCQGGMDYIIDTPYPFTLAKPAQFNPCMAYPAGPSRRCTLTDAAAQDAYFNSLVAKIGKPCGVKDHRFVGATSDGTSFYEVACNEGKGYIFEIKADNSVGRSFDCAVADQIGGGCTLTNAREAQTEQASLYTRLAKAAGYNCDVAKYSPFEVNLPGHEVVELSCNNRPDGAVGVFAASPSEPAQIYNCAHSELEGYRCSFTKPDAAFATLTADLNKVGKTSCTVSGSRFIGRTTDNQGFVEVACSDGNPGFVISYVITGPTFTPKEALGCSLAKGILGGCQMPENLKHG